MDVGGGGHQTVGKAKEEGKCGGRRRGSHQEGDGMEEKKAVTNYCRLRGGKEWWENRVGRTDDAVCPRCREEDDTQDHIVFRCMKIKRIKDAERRGRRELVRENGIGWDSWDALASKKWVRMEDTGRVDDEGKAVFERVDLMAEFFRNIRCLEFHYPARGRGGGEV